MLLRYDGIVALFGCAIPCKLTGISPNWNTTNQTTCARALETAALTSKRSAREAAQPRPHPQLLVPAAKETAVVARTDASAV